MGKRKYESEEGDSSKKNRENENVEENNSENADMGQPQNSDSSVLFKKNKLNNVERFDIKHFRKEIATKQGQTMVLTQFLKVCLNPDSEVDYILEYLKAGGNSHEILHQINDNSKKNLTLATPAFHLFHLIIVKVQSSLPHMIAVTEEACRYFLNTFISTVEIMISENSGPRHRKIILNLLTSIVTLNPDLGIELLNQVPLSPKHLKYIVEKHNYKEKENVRTAFVHFITSFLVDGHLPLIKALLEKQGLLALMIPGLVQDEAEAVFIFLNILKKNVIDNTFITKSLKLKTFSHQVLHNMFKIYSWKGPQDLSNELRNESRSEIMELLTEILLTLFTSHRLGLYFIDNSLGTADANKNQNLYKALLTLKRPWENEDQCKTILEIVYKCPDLHRAVINIVEQSFEPQHSPIWERTMEFVLKLVDKLNPENMFSRLSNLSSMQVANFVRFVTLPVSLLKHIQSNIGKDHSISLYCIKVLVKMLDMLKRYICMLEIEDSHIKVADLRNKLEYFVPKHLPTPTIIVSLIHDFLNGKENVENSNDYRLTKINDTESLIHLIDLLLLYNEVHPTFFETLEGSLDMKKILDFSTTLSSGYISRLKFKIVSLWLTLDNSAISVTNPMFKDLFLILLEIYMNDDDDMWIEAKDTIHIFFKNTTIFEGDEEEIHLMLYTLRNSKVNPPSIIGDILEYVLKNNKELTEYVRNQIIHFEISDENSETCLDKLFNDLMENQTTEDSGFLDNKMPSPFIVGCIQYIQNKKELKKTLKSFLSLYVANLLHSNYSPELTDIFIGDSKLEARNYVASWIGEPVSLPETMVGKDNILLSISKSIIEDEPVLLNDIFAFLEESSTDEYDFALNDVSYKINLKENIDRSQLLIWAKYLIFCIVRLANMNQLNDIQQKKIMKYFETIIIIAKKRHMMDVCRTIIFKLFNNQHLLKIYSPLDLNKDSSSILATIFLLDIINKYSDIVHYLNKKHKMLKHYQQKNCNEIIKAFIKINKRKNVDSGHTIKILEVVGLVDEDDELVFRHIFSVKTSSCIKHDKEPSLVLEILRVLIEKYSKSVTLELTKEKLNNILKLYTDLLTHKDITPNLTNIENSLNEYFECKPHQAKCIADDLWTHFFYANIIRKSTSHLASTLLIFNPKFCQIFKEQIKRTEILSQRELTLPLGNAILNHNQFLSENNELLSTIYNEYKSNILKLLEKPHKAGQIYISCWKFIRKLVLECMELGDCEKIFSNSHKFEAIEISHIHLMQAVFLKMCLFDKSHKKEYLINYFLIMLNIITAALKDGKEIDILNNIISNVYNVVQISETIEGFDTKQKDGFQKITESAIWQNFCKAVLKNSLKVRKADHTSSTSGPQQLCLLTTLVELYYPLNHDDIATLFDMVTSHSEFLNVMLSHHSSDVKLSLIELLYALIMKKESVMKGQQVPVYLSAYHATKSPCDRLILSLLHFYETHGQLLEEYKPYLWGNTAANHYAVRKNRTQSLWARPSPNHVLNLFEKDIIGRTVQHFSVTQKLDYNYKPASIIHVTGDEIPYERSAKSLLNKMLNDNIFKLNQIKDIEASINGITLKAKYTKTISELSNADLSSFSHSDQDNGIYDPAFLFPLLSHLMAPGSIASCYKILRSGLLSVPVMALSSMCPAMRAAAYSVLHRFCLLLETETRHKNDKLLLTSFIETLRRSLSTAIVNEENSEDTIENLRIPRLPAVDALYLGKALMVYTAPFDPLYKPVNNFLMAKEFVDLTVVPDFLSLFHDSDVESADRRIWILETIKDGTKTMTDVNVIFKTMCLKMIMDFYVSVLSDRKTRERILGVISSLVAIPRAFEILVEGYGLISWLHAVVRQLDKDDKILVNALFNVIRNIIYSINLNAFGKIITASSRNGKSIVDLAELKPNKDVEHEILLIFYDLLQHVEDLDSEYMDSYVQIYKLFSDKTVKQLPKKLLNLISRCGVIMKDGGSTKLLTKSIIANDVTILYSKIIDPSNLILDLKSIVHTHLM